MTAQPTPSCGGRCGRCEFTVRRRETTGSILQACVLILLAACGREPSGSTVPNGSDSATLVEGKTLASTGIGGPPSSSTSAPPRPSHHETAAEGAVPAKDLVIRVDWGSLEGRTFEATFENRGSRPVVILPQLLHVDVPGAFVPAPGPPIDPQRGAFLLAAGAQRRVEILCDGIWRLEPGRHRGRVRYLQDGSTALRAGSPLPSGERWRGDLVLEEDFESTGAR